MYCKNHTDKRRRREDTTASKRCIMYRTHKNRETNMTHPLSISPQHHHPLLTPTDCTVCMCVTGVFSGDWDSGGIFVWSLPVFLSGNIQQCFCSMPGNTCQQTTKGSREEEGEGEETLISQRLEADKQCGEALSRAGKFAVAEQRQTHISHAICIKRGRSCIYPRPFFCSSVI